MSDILERARAVHAKVASETHVTIWLDLLEGLIAEIERLSGGPGIDRPWRHPSATSIGDIAARQQLKADPS